MRHQVRVSVFLGICCIAVALFSCASSANTIKTAFFEAENCYQSLQESPQKQKYRSYWLRCIKQFMRVYEKDPDGLWASAGLYKAGYLYYELYKHSYKASDKQEAIDIYQRILKRFPQSAYCKKARKQLQQISSVPETATRSAKQRETSALSARKLYAAGEKCYRKLTASARKKKYRCYWHDCIDAFYQVYDHDPEGPWAAAGLYMAGKLQCELYKHSYREGDRQEGARFFAKIVREFPESAYRDQAAAALRDIPDSGKADDLSQPAVAEEKQPAAPDRKGVVQGLRYWSNVNYTRVVVDADRDLAYSHNLLRKDPVNGKPPRLYVDLQNSRLDQELSRNVRIDDNLLKDIRAGQFTPDSVRVVIDIKSFASYNIFSLNNPFRIVIDVRGKGEQTPVAGDSRQEQEKGASLAEQLSLKVGRIVIDPGHGGRDGGAPGREPGIHEKKVVLDLSRRLAEKIRRDLGYEVIMTRADDRFLTLEERTAIANTKNADLFLSIHTNACLSRDAHGIETYFLNLATDADAMRVAARENSTSEKNISDLQKILNDLMQNAKINESSRLAGYVQSSLCENLRRHYSRIKNKGVKQAPFYVLLGAQMPAILIETGFISNKTECRRLINGTYQDRICEGIVKGIRDYVNRTKSAAFIRQEKG